MEGFKKMKSFLPPVMPFRWACAYGEDRIGLWQAFEVAGVRQVMRWIPPGEFLMGFSEDEHWQAEDYRQHQVLLNEGFWLADTVCTQEIWEAVMGDNPSLYKDDKNNPVETVSWLDVVERFLPKIQEFIPGLQLQLPTEAQWEYACRAGTTTKFSFGENVTTDQVNFDGKMPYGSGPKGIFRGKTVAVKALPANPWGLYQMHGNVWEWCIDEFAPYPEVIPNDPVVLQGVGRRNQVIRGGSWCDRGEVALSAFRYAYEPNDCNNTIGFRLAVVSR